MEINIQSTTKQVASCGELDRLAHDYLGVPTYATPDDDDLSAGCRQGDTFKLPTPITATDGVYSDTKAAFAAKDITINGTEYQRFLCDDMRKVVALALEGDADAKVTAAKADACTNINSMFQSNTDIENIDLNALKNVKEINYAFANCTNLKYLDCGNVTSFKTAIRYCTNLETLIINNAVSFTRSNGGLFENTGNIKKFIVPDHGTIFQCEFYDSYFATGYLLFNNNTSCNLYLKSDKSNPLGTTSNPLIIPHSLTSISSYALYGCKSIVDLRYDGSCAELKALTFGTTPFYGIGATYIQCSDGQVALSGGNIVTE